MTTGYLTVRDQVIAKMMIDKALVDSDMIKNIIERDIKSIAKLRMGQGSLYYNVQHDILQHENYFWLDGNKKVDEIRANNKAPHPFHKMLVDQKVAYIAGNPIVTSIAQPDVKDEKNPTPAEQAAIDEAADFEEQLHDQLGNDFDEHVNDWITGSSNKGVEWSHFYVAPDEKFYYIICPAQGIIPVYESRYQRDLIYVFRYYSYELIDKGESVSRWMVEWWSKTDVQYWRQDREENYVLEEFQDGHYFSYNTKDAEKKREYHSWGVVPFVPLLNNTNGTTDLEPIKTLIDIYDEVVSGWVNDLEDLQEMILVVKGLAPVRSKIQKGLSDLAVWLQNLKNSKVITLDADTSGTKSGVEPLKVEIPFEAKVKLLDITRKGIYYFGEGVDVDVEKLGPASGVALRFYYALLDLKAARTVRKLKTALTQFMWFMVRYLNEKNSTQFDAKEILFTINLSRIFSETEKIKECMDSKGIISDQTIMENHPWVDDPEEEQARIDAERERADEENATALKDVVPEDMAIGPDGKSVPKAVEQNA